MQYGQLTTRSFSIMWRYRYLWLLAILGGADVGTCGGGFNGSVGNRTGGTTEGGTGSSSAAAQQVAQFIQDNLGLIVTLLVLVLVLALAWFLLSCVTTGALVRASAEHDAERPYRLGLAWRAGLQTFWSILGLRLIGLALGLVVLAVIGLLVLLGVLAYGGGQSGALVAVVVVGVMFVIALVPAAILAGIAFIVATRSVVLEQRGAVAALGRALRLLRARLGRALLVWLIQVGLGLAAAIAILIPLLIVVLVLGALVVGVGLAAGPVPAIVVGVPIGLVVLAALVVLGGMSGTYLSTYWTLAFRRMELDVPRPPASWPPAGSPPAGSPPQPPR
jgi:hypothetical protein